MIKNLKIGKAILTTSVLGTLICAGCTKVSAEDALYFQGVDDAYVESYYRIGDDDNEYFIRRGALSQAIPEYDISYNIGLRVDENGNTIAVPTDEIEEGDSVITCHKTWDEEKSKISVYMSDVDYATVEKGYRIKQNGVAYDLIKTDVVDFLNEEGLSLTGNGSAIGRGKYVDFEANPNGGPDHVVTRKK